MSAPKGKIRIVTTGGKVWIEIFTRGKMPLPPAMARRDVVLARARVSQKEALWLAKNMLSEVHT